MTDTTTHVAGPVVKLHHRYIQRCCVCGEKLADNNDPDKSIFWSEGNLIREEYRFLHSVGDFLIMKDVPSDFCLELVE